MKLTKTTKQKLKAVSEAFKEWNESICECGHHSKDHSWSLAPKCSDMECDKCNCQNYKPKEKGI